MIYLYGLVSLFKCFNWWILCSFSRMVVQGSHLLLPWKYIFFGCIIVFFHCCNRFTYNCWSFIIIYSHWQLNCIIFPNFSITVWAWSLIMWIYGVILSGWYPSASGYLPLPMLINNLTHSLACKENWNTAWLLVLPLYVN